MTRSTRILILFAFVAVLFGPIHSSGQNSSDVPGVNSKTRLPDKRTSINVMRIRSRVLVEILNYGFVRELNSELQVSDTDLRLRLYAIPKEGDCVKDTHFVCSNHYYLAVSAFEAGLGEAAYDLGEVGEIRQITWLKSDRQQTAHLRITVSNYPMDRFEDNDALPKKEHTYELQVRLDRISIRTVK